ncbi:hypothetical protein ACLB2K_003615 [Fragaria x ananassa]
MADVVSPIIRTINLFIKVGMKVYEVHSNFDSRTRSVIKWLQSLLPVIQQFEKLNDPTYMKIVKDLESKLVEGQSLIENCTEVSALELIKKHSLTKDLRELIEDISRLLLVLETHTKFNLKERQDDAGAFTSFTCELPDFPHFAVGLEKPLVELKMKLLREGTSVLVLTGPGGFGKTTLAKKFCEYEDVTGNG